ncbi:hypothetical protein PAAG_06801 [Paracoccidioides lutzii Pb01]|uniref:Uncharacterized protein n=1 Tax=Paracoccidioides lutzii (strain ATCC MYA-826 / Pb01) TaxID=502779 RepID=C1H7R0_PARBA|nr:hypothetical protein PAAG_06801 [Paracoccidioides lutzii Pb01]EEH36383.2 hypothetical protein PAAG_06801 [Paracoccidioides lutzii Pb01]
MQKVADLLQAAGHGSSNQYGIAISPRFDTSLQGCARESHLDNPESPECTKLVRSLTDKPGRSSISNLTASRWLLV